MKISQLAKSAGVRAKTVRYYQRIGLMRTPPRQESFQSYYVYRAVNSVPRMEAEMANAKLIYMAIASLDGYVADESGNFSWAAPDDEVHSFINDLERSIGTYLFGRKMYETMEVWETLDASAPPGSVTYDFSKIWKSANKVVYSTTLDRVSTSKTRIERAFEPAAVKQMKTEATRDIAVGGPHLAVHAFKAGLIDECGLFVAPVIVGAGNKAFPERMHVDLELVEHRAFGSGFTYARYRIV